MILKIIQYGNASVLTFCTKIGRTLEKACSNILGLNGALV